MADTHQVMLWWWASKPVARDVWRERENALPVGPRLRRRQAAPAVVYPEAVDLAEAMNQWEELRGKTGVAEDDWIAEVAARFGAPGIADSREREPFRYWLQLHPPQPGRKATSHSKPERRWAWLPTLHHQVGDRGPFRANSCLRWVFGRHLTSTTQLCLYCRGRELSCHWTPSPDCPQRSALVEVTRLGPLRNIAIDAPPPAVTPIQVR
ncbi:hypothetical protein [Streptomyces jeddahensis]|uniref:Uncharacterized protein n=1 Tax=Streptomyces jeddahensis TaxID=1716141 RepID=A0A177HTK1_9ACTN|nr:hypothetical protein [Streptomyces jeddahensis]OAH14321.1 hypothetical protein STSP_23820 [Streptomyces jeddahensis]